MSPPTSGPPNGQQKDGPQPHNLNANARPFNRPAKRRPADPLVRRKRNPTARPLGPPRPTEGPPLGLNPLGEAKSMATLESLRKQYGGWSEPPPKDYRDFPIVTTAKALREGIRHHVMRLSRSRANDDDKPVDPTDQNVFTRPVTLHRRDPRQPPAGRVASTKEATPEPKAVDDKEIERLQQIKAEREAQRAIDQAKIAPSVKDMNSKKQKKPKEEKISFNRMPRTEQGRKEADLRYEEALPWHLEDVDGRNVWVGNYVAALSETNVAFVIDGARFRMVPLEKWYKFTAKPAFERIPEDKVEDFMKKTAQPGRWMMQALEKREEERKMKDEFRNHGKRLSARAAPSANEVRGYDEVDMEGDEFDDDDENPGFENDDEDMKISNARIRQNQLGANLFGDGDENEVDAQEENELRRELERRKATKKLKKTLIKRENVNDIESDDSASSADPFADSSSEEEEEEEEDESQVKPEDEDKSKSEKEKAASSAGSKGSTTPSGKRQADITKKSKGLKRPGSPHLSESSGNESTLRKKAKTKPDSITGHSRSTTPLPHGQSVTTQVGQRRKMVGGSASDGEATAGEMSDTQPRKKKIKLVGTSARGTPTGSRAASPLPTQTAGSPSVSPTKESQGARSGSPKPAIEAWEIVQALPQLPDGITIANFLKLFEGRVGDNVDGGRMAKSEWIRLVRENCHYGPDKLLRRKS
ncbi:hypothetical protein jhhlp_007689 [Lomentospora prolificans]|uniref:Uncharacterized protein n=1 Tax=Lomentospora prolificans TaxID=41688 RepID=A0A2N3N0B3_9PEZI|nr:hypothetical protein jhhlp_007689 [Lomentospora prolificans]